MFLKIFICNEPEFLYITSSYEDIKIIIYSYQRSEKLMFFFYGTSIKDVHLYRQFCDLIWRSEAFWVWVHRSCGGPLDSLTHTFSLGDPYNHPLI
jgi:hypothetical protein